MKTVKEVSKITGVSIRTLHYYHSIGLLNPTQITESGYRLYDDMALQKLYVILLFRELHFSLKEIKAILENKNFDLQEALQQQVNLLKRQRDHLDEVISRVCQIQKTGVDFMSFKVFDKTKIKEYEAEAKCRWGDTEAYKEYEQRTKGKEASVDHDLMNIFAKFGAIKHQAPECDEAQALVKELQEHITSRYYTCTNHILQNLGLMYIAGDSMTDNIDAAGGIGTAEFAHKAIESYCK